MKILTEEQLNVMRVMWSMPANTLWTSRTVIDELKINKPINYVTNILSSLYVNGFIDKHERVDKRKIFEYTYLKSLNNYRDFLIASVCSQVFNGSEIEFKRYLTKRDLINGL